MVSLLISKFGKLISGKTPGAAVAALKRRGYLSDTGLERLDAIQYVIVRVEQSWPTRPALGEEQWRTIQATLETRGFLSEAGLAAAREFVSRR